MSGMNCKSQTPCSILAPRQAYAAAFINGMHLQLADGWNKQTDENRAHGRRLLAREAWDFADAMIAEESNDQAHRPEMARTGDNDGIRD